MKRRYNPLAQLTLVKIRELLREPEALFWIFAFPLLLAIALGVAFRARPLEVLRVGVAEEEGAAWIEEALAADPGLDPELMPTEGARNELRTGRVALVVLPGDPWVYWFDPTRPESRLARLAVDDALQSAAGRSDPRPSEIREMREKGSRYIDFLIPGLVGMNLLGTGVWGLGYYVVNARSNKLLKRMIAAPMRKSDFLLAQIFGRLIFLVPEVGILLVFAAWVLDVPVRGSLLALGAITFTAAMTFAGLGLLVGSRARTVEGVSGLMNVVIFPLWLLSGIFFSTSRFPDSMQPVIQALPLTAVNDALRAVMIDGASFAAIGGEFAIVVGWGVAVFAAALALFRWT